MLYYLSQDLAGQFSGLNLFRYITFRTAAALVTAAAVIAVLRSAVNPGPSLLLRDRNFRSVAAYEVSASAVDLATTLALISAGLGPMAMIVGSAAGEATRLTLSWFAFRVPVQPNLRWRSITHLTHYGKWIWGTSVLTLLLQDDTGFLRCGVQLGRAEPPGAGPVPLDDVLGHGASPLRKGRECGRVTIHRLSRISTRRPGFVRSRGRGQR